MSLAITELASFAERLADASGPIARGYFRSGLNIDIKADDSPVTRADREVEAHMREMIAATYPDHGIIGEEHGSTGADREYVWILDPIDGTKAFITGRPLFGTLIGLLRDGQPILGVIDHPALNERWIGGLDYPTRFAARRRGRGFARRWKTPSWPPPRRKCSSANRLSRACANVSNYRFGAAIVSTTAWSPAATSTWRWRPVWRSTTIYLWCR